MEPTSFSRRNFIKSAATTAAILALNRRRVWGADASPPSTQSGSIITDGSGKRFAPGPVLNWTNSSDHVDITIDPKQTAQTLSGFGSALTDAACYNLALLPDSSRHQLLTELFSPDQMGLTVCRICIGASDYTTDCFSYDDGAPDPDLNHFTIDHDQRRVIPILREALAINPNLFLFASPWSPPGWMKYGGSMCGGSLQLKNSDVYAHYILKYLQAYQAAGVHVSAITIQNETDTDQNGLMPACTWSQEVEDRYIAEHLGPLLQKESPSTRIWILDHNYDLIGRVLDQMAKPEVRRYINAVAWHGYGGEPEQMKLLWQTYPGMEMRFTEWGDHFDARDYLTDWASWSTRFTRILRNGPSSITTWNLALDENGKPNIGPAHCGGLVTIHSGTREIIRSGLYWTMQHYSRGFIPGSKIVATRGDVSDVSHIAAMLPGGGIVLILSNTGAARAIRIASDDKVAEFNLPADSVVTLMA